MKKMIWMILFLLAVTGCGRKPEEDTMQTERRAEETTAVTETMIATEATMPTEPELLAVLVKPKDTDFVRVTDYIPNVITELKYHTHDNFTGQVIYEFEDVFLRYGTVRKLQAVVQELEQQGLGIKIWDGFRPVSAQFKLWEICPNSTYVANPNKGYSNHSRGFAVDLTLVDSRGEELEMPTGFDDFSARADRDYSDCTQVQTANAQLLEAVMEKHGFQGYWGEWWHFNDTTKYDVESCFDPGVIARRYVATQTSLLEQYWEEPVVLTVPVGEAVTVLGYQEEYVMAEYWGYRGYIAQKDLR